MFVREFVDLDTVASLNTSRMSQRIYGMDWQVSPLRDITLALDA